MASIWNVVGDEQIVSLRQKRQISLNVVDEELFCFAAEVQVSRAFLAWSCSFDDDLVVTQPPTVVDKVKRHIDKLMACYNNATK